MSVVPRIEYSSFDVQGSTSASGTTVYVNLTRAIFQRHCVLLGVRVNTYAVFSCRSYGSSAEGEDGWIKARLEEACGKAGP